MKKAFFLMVIVFVFVYQAVASEPIGIVVNNNTNDFHLINPLTQTLSDPFLKGSLGSYGGGLFDVVCSKDGRTAIISNFGDSTIYFVDISGGFSGTPTVLGSVTLPIFAEDMDITADGKYVVVSDGGFSPRLEVVDIASRTLAVDNQLGAANSAQAVAISGNVIVAADYFGGGIHSFTIDDSGIITYSASAYAPGMRPVNIAVSPDGKTVISVDSARYDFDVFSMDATGGLNYKGRVATASKGGQSCVFSKDGTKAYYYSNSILFPPRIYVLNITGPGEVAVDSYIDMSIPRGTSQLFGVDTIAVDPSGNYLYVSNPTVSGGVVEVTVIDLTTKTEVNQLHCLGIPTGIYFTTIQ